MKSQLPRQNMQNAFPPIVTPKNKEALNLNDLRLLGREEGIRTLDAL